MNMTPEKIAALNLSKSEASILLMSHYAVQDTRDLEAKVRVCEHTEQEFKLQVLGNQRLILLLLLNANNAFFTEKVLEFNNVSSISNPD